MRFIETTGEVILEDGEKFDPMFLEYLVNRGEIDSVEPMTNEKKTYILSLMAEQIKRCSDIVGRPVTSGLVGVTRV